jgi:hypothetical protein
MPPEFGGMV